MQEIRFSDLTPKEVGMSVIAIATRNNAHAPYSGYKVGAVYEDELGNLHFGCNVENAALKGSCAEFGAISALVASGGKEVRSMMVVLKGAATPCGSCLQQTWEFCKGNKEMPILLLEPNGPKGFRTTIGELFPYPFDF